MTVEQATALIVALTAMVTAIGVVVVQLVSLRKQIDGRLSELLEQTKLASGHRGELIGRDFADAARATLDAAPTSGATAGAPPVSAREAPPSA